MNKATRGSIEYARMMTIQQACDYTGLGRTSMTKWGRSIGAVKKFGAAVRYDKAVIDRVLDEMKAEVER